MKILVVIVTYNAMQWSERCLNSLHKSKVKPDVFVVDNGSSDGTQAYIKEHYPEVLFLQSKENIGFGRANNLGLQYALDNGYDYVYLLNQDAWVMPDTFNRLIALYEQYPEYGILSPFQMNNDMRIDRNFIANVMEWKSNPEICSDLYTQQLKDIYPVLGVMAAHWFLPISTIKKVGGFSPTFTHYAEDDNYIDRVHFWGMKIGIVPSLRVVHDRGWREDSDNKLMYFGYTNSLRFLSNPLMGRKKSFAKVLEICIRNVILFKSIKPIYYMFRIMFLSFDIFKNKKKSMSEVCAFLKA